MAGHLSSWPGEIWPAGSLRLRIRRAEVKSDLLPLLGTLVVAGPVAFLPNLLLASWLFGDSQVAVNLLLRPLPLWAVYARVIFFALTQGLAEISTYFAYAMPRLEAAGLHRWLAVSLPALMLGLQHLAVPLLFDVRYLTWRGLMYNNFPFAFLVGLVLRWRSRLLPYLVVTHVVMDLAFAAMLFGVAY
jgi:hypothetical protein